MCHVVLATAMAIPILGVSAGQREAAPLVDGMPPDASALKGAKERTEGEEVVHM